VESITLKVQSMAIRNEVTPVYLSFMSNIWVGSNRMVCRGRI